MRSGEVAVALALDAAFGEPPARLHPVVWMGRLIDLLERLTAASCADHSPDDGRATRWAGALAAGLGGAVTVAVAVGARRLPWPARGVVLWTLLSGRLLLAEVAAVERALHGGGLEAGRERIARLVSRDTSSLTAPQVRAAAVQTLAENTTDSVTATLWWWSLGGLPAAALHRWVDTLDSRWGYHDEGRQDRGRAAALADDVMAWVPARLTGVLWHGGLDPALHREAARTPSPNGGWTMGAAALATDSRLEKPGAYVLHPRGRDPDVATMTASLRDARRVLASAAALCLAGAAVGDGVRSRRGRA